MNDKKKSITMKFILCIAVIFLVQNGESATFASKDLLHELQELNRQLITETKVAQPDDTNVDQQKELREESPRKAMYLREVSPRAVTQLHNSNTLRHANLIVGFTAYLERSVDLHPGQTLIYDTVLTNEGLAYNPNTGEFKCPVSGLYLFSFSVGTRNKNQAWVRLTVNHTPQVDGAADGFNKYEDTQGGGTVVLELMAGDLVSVKAFNDMKYNIDNSAGGRLNFFSGALLFYYY